MDFGWKSQDLESGKARIGSEGRGNGGREIRYLYSSPKVLKYLEMSSQWLFSLSRVLREGQVRTH
jgi:hypothetical protein